MKFVMLPLKNKMHDVVLLYNKNSSSSNIRVKRTRLNAVDRLG